MWMVPERRTLTWHWLSFRPTLRKPSHTLLFFWAWSAAWRFSFDGTVALKWRLRWETRWSFYTWSDTKYPRCGNFWIRTSAWQISTAINAIRMHYLTWSTHVFWDPKVVGSRQINDTQLQLHTAASTLRKPRPIKSALHTQEFSTYHHSDAPMSRYQMGYSRIANHIEKPALQKVWLWIHSSGERTFESWSRFIYESMWDFVYFAFQSNYRELLTGTLPPVDRWN